MSTIDPTGANEPVTLSDCRIPHDIDRIQQILNHAIAHSTALYDYEPRSFETVHNWAIQKQQGNWPLRGAFDADGQLLGFATFGPFRPQPAYKYTVEHSIYIDEKHRGKGIANTLMADLLAIATAKDLHQVIGCIDAQNAVSIALHEKFGFVYSGTIREAGFKFGRWLDAAFYQKTLATPASPIDG